MKILLNIFVINKNKEKLFDFLSDEVNKTVHSKGVYITMGILNW